MRRLLFLLLFLFPLPGFAAFPYASTSAGPGIIHGCYDGDKLGLRLVGIDTPEMKGKCSEELALALIIVDGLDLADAFVEAALARNYSGEAKQSWCQQ